MLVKNGCSRSDCKVLILMRWLPQAQLVRRLILCGRWVGGRLPKVNSVRLSSRPRAFVGWRLLGGTRLCNLSAYRALAHVRFREKGSGPVLRFCISPHHQFVFSRSTGTSQGRETFQLGFEQWNSPQRPQNTTMSPKYAGCVSRNAAASSAVFHHPRSLPSPRRQCLNNTSCSSRS